MMGLSLLSAMVRRILGVKSPAQAEAPMRTCRERERERDQREFKDIIHKRTELDLHLA